MAFTFSAMPPTLLGDVERARYEALSMIDLLDELYQCLALKSQRIDDAEWRKSVGHSHHGICAAWNLYIGVDSLLRNDYGIMVFALRPLLDMVCPDAIGVAGEFDTNVHGLALHLAYEVMGGLPVMSDNDRPPKDNVRGRWKGCLEQLAKYPCTMGDLKWLKAKVQKESMRARLEVEAGRITTLRPSGWRHQDASYQRRDEHLTETDAELLPTLPGLIEHLPLDRKEVSILIALRRFHPVTMTIERVEHTLEQMSRGMNIDAALKELVEAITARTISDRLKRLIARGLVKRPRGSKGGCAITDAGLNAIKLLP